MLDEKAIETKAERMFRKHCLTSMLAMFDGAHAEWWMLSEDIKNSWRDEARKALSKKRGPAAQVDGVPGEPGKKDATA